MDMKKILALNNISTSEYYRVDVPPSMLPGLGVTPSKVKFISRRPDQDCFVVHLEDGQRIATGGTTYVALLGTEELCRECGIEIEEGQDICLSCENQLKRT